MKLPQKILTFSYLIPIYSTTAYELIYYTPGFRAIPIIGFLLFTPAVMAALMLKTNRIKIITAINIIHIILWEIIGRMDSEQYLENILQDLNLLASAYRIAFYYIILLPYPLIFLFITLAIKYGGQNRKISTIFFILSIIAAIASHAFSILLAQLFLRQTHEIYIFTAFLSAGFICHFLTIKHRLRSRQ